jgi:hypothetical protein
MSTGLFWLDAALLTAIFIMIPAYIVFRMTIKSSGQRKPERAVARVQLQPWSSDKAGGRANH